jgi:hypothetical protein
MIDNLVVAWTLCNLSKGAQFNPAVLLEAGALNILLMVLELDWQINPHMCQ